MTQSKRGFGENISLKEHISEIAPVTPSNSSGASFLFVLPSNLVEVLAARRRRRLLDKLIGLLSPQSPRDPAPPGARRRRRHALLSRHGKLLINSFIRGDVTFRRRPTKESPGGAGRRLIYQSDTQSNNTIKLCFRKILENNSPFKFSGRRRERGHEESSRQRCPLPANQ
ncbi:hypothetical protein EVAR_86431_1 [Eumeta japonica]|uniref:Uncharacterized protein n=1 Tax=Eumeta variegata TaxID=151549 RepID=A0A4C1ZCV1_EUMVA|nr:hypothetical protein EVAR_86431_1 [Eumeta japonica]